MLSSPAPVLASAVPCAFNAPTPVPAVAVAYCAVPTPTTTIIPGNERLLASVEETPTATALEITVKSDAYGTSGEPSPLSPGDSPDEEASGPLGAWKKNVWTPAEDQHLLQLITASGEKVRWSVIGEQMNGRSGKQCRERWHNHLSPEVRKAKWTPEEDRAIVDAVQTYGTRWSEIVKMFPGRTDNAIKNRWNSMQRKEDRRQKRLNDSSSSSVPTAHNYNSNASQPRFQATAVEAVIEHETTTAAERTNKRRRLVQVADYQPAVALRHPVDVATVTTPEGTAVVLGAALAQQLSSVGVAPPQMKTGGRRKRAVQARDDMAAASLVLGLNKNDDADLVAAAPEAAASWPQPVLPVADAMLVQPTATAAAAVAAASAAVVAAASATPALPATALARPIFAAPAVAAPAYVAPAPMAAPAAAASSSYTTAAASASTTPPRASTFAAPSGLVKAVALGSLQVAPSNKENSCSDSPARGHGAGGASPGPSKVLTPSGNSPYRHNKSSSLRHSASADWEAGLEAALAIQALHAGR